MRQKPAPLKHLSRNAFVKACRPKLQEQMLSDLTDNSKDKNSERGKSGTASYARTFLNCLAKFSTSSSSKTSNGDSKINC